MFLAVLLERVFLGIVMSETDEQFESIINKVLLSVIQKLSSPNESVKNKVGLKILLLSLMMFLSGIICLRNRKKFKSEIVLMASE